MKKYLYLFLIVLIGAVLRFYKLGEVPLGFHRDEAFFAYNAFSILKTGNDMSGNFFPLHFQSFLYSPAGYSYFSIPFIFLLGLNEFSARAASSLFGLFTIIAGYFLTLELFYERKDKTKLALVAAFFLAVSPWNIILSRVSTENVIVVFFIALATYLFLLALRKSNDCLVFTSFIFYFITLYIYQAPRSFLPLFIPILFFIFLYKKISTKKTLAFVLSYIVLIIFPIFLVMISPQLSLRLRTLNVFYSEKTRANLGQAFRSDGTDGRLLIETRIFHNKITGYAPEIINNYFSHLSFSFFFTDSYFPDRYRIPSFGLMYFFEFPILLLGIWELLKRKEKNGLFLIIWVLTVPIGASLTFDDIPNMQRTLLFFPALSIISAVGAIELIKYCKKKKIVQVLFFLIIIYSITSFIHQYFIDGKYYRNYYRQEGYKELVQKVNKYILDYKYVVITNRETAPTIFFLFFNKYDPMLFQEESRDKNKEQTDSISFDKYVFSRHECPLSLEIDELGNKKLLGESEVLYVNSGLCKDQEELSYIDEIKRTDGSTVFKLAEYKEK